VGIELIGGVDPEPQMRVGMGLGAKLGNEQRDRRNDGNPKLDFSAQSFHGGSELAGDQHKIATKHQRVERLRVMTRDTSRKFRTGVLVRGPL